MLKIPYHETMGNGFGDQWGVYAARVQTFGVQGFFWRKPTWAQRLLGALLAAIILGLLILILVPALVVGATVMLLGAGYYGLRRGLNRLLGRGGLQSGRRNVRIILREDQAR